MNQEKEQNHENAPAVAEESKTAASGVKKSRKKRWCCRIGGALSLVVFTPIAFLMTGFGQRTAIEWADKSLDALSIGAVEGSIQSGLTLSDAQYEMDGVNAKLGQANLHIDFGCLLSGKVCLETVALKDAHVTVDTTKLPPAQEEPDNSEPFTELKLPLPIALNQLSLDNIQVEVDGMNMQLGHFHSGISGEGRKLSLHPTALNDFVLLLPQANETQAVQKEEKIAKEAENSTASQTKTDWEALKAQLSKPLLTKASQIRLPLDFEIPQLEVNQVRIEQQTKTEKAESLFVLHSLKLQASANDQNVTLQQLSVDSDQGKIEGQGKLTLADQYPLDMYLHADVPTLKAFGIPASKADLALSGALFDETKLNLSTQGAATLTLDGGVKLAEPRTPLHLTLKSEGIQYPFMPEKGQEPLKLQNLNVSFSGDLLDYQLATAVKSSGMNLPPAALNLKGKGTLTQFNIEDLNLNALEGKTQLTGLVDWADGVSWQSQLNLNGVNSKSLVPDWAAVLNGQLESSGYAGRGKNGEEWQVDVKKVDLNGLLNQRHLQLKGQLSSQTNNLLNVPGLDLQYGENHIAMSGHLGDKSDFNAQIKAPNLQGLVPNLKAEMNGNVKLSGKIAEPNVDLDLVAKNVSFDAMKLQSLTAKGQVKTEKNIQGDVNLDLRQFSYNDIKLDQAQLAVKGSEANHQLQLTSKGNPVGANLQISGKFDRLQETWSGQLTQAQIQTTDYGNFHADKPVAITYQNKLVSANISAHCWQHNQLNLCFPTAFTAGQEGKVPFELRRFDLAFVQQFLDKSSQIAGLVNAKGEAAWFKNKAPVVDVTLNSESLKFVQKMEGGSAFPLTISPLKATVKLADNNLNLKTDLKLENNGRIATDLVMKDLNKTRGLSGTVNIDQISLKLIKPLLTGGERVDGLINARLTLGGSATAPLLHGRLGLSELRVKSATMPFDVTGGNLDLNFNGTSSTLNGRVQTTESELFLTGNANWQDLSAWRTEVHAKANRFRVNVPNIAKVEFSPDISVTATPKELILGGVIDIPWARIEVEELPESAVGVSSDEVIMDGSAKTKVPFSQRQLPEQTSSGMAIKSDLKINIGDDVSLNAYGLKTNLNGTIAVRQGKQGLGLYGQVNLLKGRFASFGQDLLIRKGIIQFAGLPSQPTLNFEAIRNPEAMEDPSVTAGVKVTGIADNLNVKVFSDPQTSQDQALSYLLTGRSLENSGEAGSSNSMAAALLSMSLSKSAKTVGKVGSTFGLNDLSVSTAGIGDNTKVEVSASLTPKFRVKYGVGIFAPLTELTLRYTLTPKLYLQWVSSVNQAVDLMYRFEFD